MLAVARRALAGWRRLRLELWAMEVRVRLRAAGGRASIELGRGATIERRPKLLAYPIGEGAGSFELRIAPGARLGRNVTIELEARGDNSLSIGQGTWVMDGVRLILRSGAIAVGAHTVVRDLAWLKSDGDLTIGDHAVVGPASVVHCAERVELEDQVGFAERVTVLDSDHTVDGSDTYFRDQPVRIEPVRIERNTFVATNAVVLRGARIGRNSLVGAGAIVRGGEYADSSLIAGSPASVVRTLPAAAGPQQARSS